jgi:hypothetical protein
MKKITELTEIRNRTFFRKDAYGNRYRDSEEYIVYRNVRTAGLGMRFAHFMVDGIIFALLFNVLSSFIGNFFPSAIDINDANILTINMSLFWLLVIFSRFFWLFFIRNDLRFMRIFLAKNTYKVSNTNDSY